ncbi:MFS transporter [Gluconacetobacter azotocaptans]|uniref:MFS transporter n=2 Tax=Gluconacetobacter azotocaptans TaxID=142834 RepID=A0A7W4JQ29_9PROT|nr:MFS transporter [Gluconacetobacter azotocaptans]MBB2188811.1 MFS transporter [Gluconacetobacter azotocaptans]MBM9402563.1 MFS transporter [Gluconacetobacter azotocaptans]GBQ31113.1 major facilitator superfamily transporter [Gluconacetobacter azotocaptans DSM 13594]
MVAKQRWLICSLLFAATTINYVDRQVLSLLKPLLEAKFSWTERDYSYLVIVFQACYVVGFVSFGKLIDKVGTRLGYAVCMTVWSIASIGHAFVSGTVSFAAMRGLLGFGESGNFPSALKAVSEWFPSRERALAVGIVTAGTSIGAIMAPATVPWLAVTWGWQATFIITGLSGFIWLAVWLYSYRIPEEKASLSADELRYIRQDTQSDTTPEFEGRWIDLLKMKVTWAFAIGKFMTDPIWFFILFWLPSYFSDRYHLNLQHLGLPLMAVYLSTSVGSVGGGWLSSFLVSKGWKVAHARRAVMLLMAALVVPLAFSAHVDAMWLMIALLSLAAAAHQGWSVNIYSLPADHFPKEIIASVQGIGGMAGSIGGMLFPLGVGVLLDHYRHLDRITAGYNILFVVCGSAYLTAWCIIQILTRDPPVAKTVSAGTGKNSFQKRGQEPAAGCPWIKSPART